MDKLKIPHFLVQKINSDGSKEEPLIYELKNFDENWKTGRRQFLKITAAIGAGMLSGISGCVAPWTQLEKGLDIGQYDKHTLAHDGPVGFLSFIYDGKILASGGGGTINLWEMPSGQLLNSFVSHLSFSPDGKMLALSENDETKNLYTITLRETKSGQLLKTLIGHTNIVMDTSFSPNGKMLVSVSEDDTIKLWNIPSGDLLKTIEVKDNVSCLLSVHFSPDGKMIASATDDTIILWDISSGQMLATLPGDIDCYSNEFVFRHPQGDLLINTDVEGQWNFPLGSFKKVNVGIVLGFSSDRKLMATTNNKDVVKVWEIPSLNLLKTIEYAKEFLEDYAFVECASFNSDGTLLAAGLNDARIFLWEVSSGQILKTIDSNDVVSSISFSPDGTLLASGEYGTIKLWKMPTCEYLKNLKDPAVKPKFSESNHHTGGSYCRCIPIK
jgi:WD40 repeat protein